MSRPRTPTDRAASEEDLRSRSDARREQKQTEDELMDLGKALVGLGDRLLGKIALPDPVRDAVMEARRVSDPSPHYRALRVVRMALRDAEPEQIRRELRNLEDPSRGATPFDALVAWRRRLLSGEDGELDAFVRAFPDADRQQLRQLIRNARKAELAGRAEGDRALTRALRKHVA